MQLAELGKHIAFETFDGAREATDLVAAPCERFGMARGGVFLSRECSMLDGEGMQRANDAVEQEEPEDKPADGEDECGKQQPEVQLRNGRERLARRPLHDNGPSGPWNGHGAEEPILTIWAWCDERGRSARERPIGSW